MSVEVPLAAGFADPVLGSQRCFRALLEAMARPGRVQALRLDLAPPAPLGPAAGAVLLTLADADTPVAQDAGPAAAEWLRFHAGCPLVTDLRGATFVLACGAPPALEALDAGTEEEPQGAATLIIQVATLEEAPGQDATGVWRLTGPGIEHEQRLRVDGLPHGFVAAWTANHEQFPRGVDVVLCAGDRLVGLPRTTRIEEG